MPDRERYEVNTNTSFFARHPEQPWLTLALMYIVFLGVRFETQFETYWYSITRRVLDYQDWQFAIVWYGIYAFAVLTYTGWWRNKVSPRLSDTHAWALWDGIGKLEKKLTSIAMQVVYRVFVYALVMTLWFVVLVVWSGDLARWIYVIINPYVWYSLMAGLMIFVIWPLFEANFGRERWFQHLDDIYIAFLVVMAVFLYAAMIILLLTPLMSLSSGQPPAEMLSTALNWWADVFGRLNRQ